MSLQESLIQEPCNKNELVRLDDFNYSPLDPSSSELRLLELMPGEGGIIHCILVHSTLDIHPSYEALSYLWGDAQVRRQILLGDIPFSVTSNLEAALRRLRDSRRSRTLWVDALCINQDDSREKTIQVQMMFRIYSQASHVIAWTGDSVENSDDAINIINTLGSFVTHDDLDRVHPFGDPSRRGLLGQLEESGFQTAVMNWEALWEFFERPYWSRVWVIQELAVRGIEDGRPCTFYCGSSTFDMREYALTCGVLVQLYLESGSLIDLGTGQVAEPLGSMYRRNNGHPPGVNMLQAVSAFNSAIKRADAPTIQWLLYITRNFQASEERDKIYALLSLARSEDRKFLPDYARPTRRTMMEFVRFLVERDNNLTYLDVSSNRRAVCPSAPSWTPEIHSEHHALDMWGMLGTQQTWQASRGADADVQFDMDTESMIAAGVLIGKIGFVIGPLRDLEKLAPGSNPANFRQVVEGLGHTDFMEHLVEYAASVHGESYETLWRTLVLDMDRDSPLEPVITPAREELGIRSRVFLMKEDIPPTFLPDTPRHVRYKAYVGPFYEKAGIALSNRTFFTTETGFSGVGPYGTQPGDLAVVLYGSGRCTVLRPEGDFYRVVGDAYVHGAMDGELVRGLDVNERVYILR